MSRRRWWGAGALFCWVVALFLAWAPVGTGDATCDRPVLDALAGNPEHPCTLESAKRVGTLVEWVVLTAPVTVMFVVQPRAPKPPAE